MGGGALVEITITESVPSYPSQNFLFECHRWKAGRPAAMQQPGNQSGADFARCQWRSTRFYREPEEEREDVWTGLKWKSCAGMSPAG